VLDIVEKFGGAAVVLDHQLMHKGMHAQLRKPPWL